MSLREEYAAARVPMLPVVVGDAAASWIILAHTIAVVLVSLLPMAMGSGLVYLAGALAGGGLFILRSIELVRNPGPKTAQSNFHASLLQLGLLLIAAIVDGSLNR
jgi:protoheme IX farnesyltransferase